MVKWSVSLPLDRPSWVGILARGGLPSVWSEGAADRVVNAVVIKKLNLALAECTIFFLLSILTFRSAWSFSDSPMSRFLFTLLIQPPNQLLPMSIIKRPIIFVCWAVCCLEGSMRPSWPSSARSWRSCSSDIRSVQVFQPVRFRSAPGSGPEKWGFWSPGG